MKEEGNRIEEETEGKVIINVWAYTKLRVALVLNSSSWTLEHVVGTSLLRDKWDALTTRVYLPRFSTGVHLPIRPKEMMNSWVSWQTSNPDPKIRIWSC